MSFTYDDLVSIRKIVEESIKPVTDDLVSIEKKILNIHSDLVEAARQAGVTLPIHH